MAEPRFKPRPALVLVVKEEISRQGELASDLCGIYYGLVTKTLNERSFLAYLHFNFTGKKKNSRLH